MRLLVGEPAGAQVAGQRLAVARREADAERRGRGLVEAALGEELARDDGVGGRQLLGVELLGDLVRLDQPAARRSARPLGLVVAVLATQLDAVLVGEPLDRLGEGEPVDLHQEGDDVAALLAAEAVEELARGLDVEGRGLLVVEGAQALERAAAGLAERDVAGDDVVDACLLAHLGDVVVADPACHVAESTGGHPPPVGVRRQTRVADDRFGVSMTQTTSDDDPTLGALVHQLTSRSPSSSAPRSGSPRPRSPRRASARASGIGMFSVAGLLAFFARRDAHHHRHPRARERRRCLARRPDRGARPARRRRPWPAWSARTRSPRPHPPSPSGPSRASRRTSTTVKGDHHA